MKITDEMIDALAEHLPVEDSDAARLGLAAVARLILEEAAKIADRFTVPRDETMAVTGQIDPFKSDAARIAWCIRRAALPHP